MNGKDPRFRRLLLSIPATLAGAFVYGLCMAIAPGTSELPLSTIIRVTLFIHAAAWIFFIAPFAFAISEKSRIYDFPLSSLYGAMLGAGAYFTIATVCLILLGLPWTLLFSDASRFLVSAALSGAAVATTMSTARMLNERSLHSVHQA